MRTTILELVKWIEWSKAMVEPIWDLDCNFSHWSCRDADGNEGSGATWYEAVVACRKDALSPD